MKKIIVALLTVAMILSAVTVFLSAEQTADQLAYVGGIHYGEAVVDGEKDITYPAEPTIDSFVYTANAAYEAGKETSFNAYLLWDDYNFYGYVEVTDHSPVTYATESWKTDCIQLYFIFQDWDITFGSDDIIVGNTNSLTDVMFRCINPLSKESANLTDATYGDKSLLWLVMNGSGNCPLVTKKTDTGYVYEFKVTMPDQITPDINRAGHAIGFGIQCNDDTNNDNERDYIIFSSNMDQKNHGKTGKFILLDANGQVPSVEQDYMGTTGSAYVTESPDDETKVTTEEVTNPPKNPTGTTTKESTTTVKPIDNTTSTPVDTGSEPEQTAGCGGFAAGIWIAFTAIVGSAVFVVTKKK